MSKSEIIYKSENIDKAVELYKKGYTYKKIGKYLKRSPSTMLLWIHQKNVKIRDKYIKVNLSPSKELCYIVGVLKGDGSINSNKNGIILRVKDEEFAKEFHRCCKTVGMSSKLVFENSQKGWRVLSYSKILINRYKEISENDILNLPDELKIAFLRGFFDSEGCYYTNSKNGIKSCKITNTNITYVNLIRELLFSLGFCSTIQTRHYSNHYRTCYNIELNGGKKKIKDFLLTIQPSIPRKQWIEPINLNEVKLLE